ncbi:uncharacterized protein LOC111405065 isoform X2 [Olea europaea var. sylvestris]|uniref:uncharacterized protein LOC111405065 isoform X2 n=1 Tax=Olea europaea var. sylvestris TaxID=158386 RepID=UPI000C1CDD05|nr:uncharacterized protein LOC111405065 isoform X2 [Olea europaea var. sylvestris]
MAGNSRFELTSASPESSFAGNYQIGQRGSYSSPALDRSGSFREGAESRMFGSGKATSRGSAMLTGELPALSQCLLLEPILMGDQKKNTRSVELRKVLGFTIGCSSEDNSFSAAHLKNSPPVAEELKRLKASVVDTCVKASGRAKKLDEHLNKLNKYFDGINSKKLQRNELSTNERSVSSNLKIGTQVNRSSLDLGNQKFEDRPKNVILSKRVRTSVAETRTEGRGNGLPRQPILVSKDRDVLKDNSADSDMVEDKIRKLPAGGEGWEKKMKRKRSVGAAFSRSIGNDGEVKRTANHKLANEHSLQSCDSSHGFRSGASNGTSATSKLDSTSSPASSSVRATFKNEQEKSVPSRDISAGPTRERVLGKGNIKLNTLEDNHVICPSPVIKGKASRAPRTGSTIPINSASNVPRLSGTLESWEQPTGVNKNPSVNGVNSRKRVIPAGSSSPPITQWVGQRPQKISRRRTNLVSVSNHDEVQMQSEGGSPPDFGARLSSCGNNPPLLSKNAANGIQNFKPKSGNVSSPARLSESEESGAGENRMKEKSVGSGYVDKKATSAGQDAGPSTIVSKKNKVVVKEEIDDGVRRQGQNGRISPFSRASISPMREKLDNVAPAKPLRNSRSGSDKSGSKSGRPLKKLSDRKVFSRLGHVANGGSPDFNGESEDDHEELLSVASSACNSSFLACSSPFWKKVETMFTSIGTDKKSYLLQKLKLAEEFGSSSQFSSHGNDVQGDVHEKISAFDSLSGKTNRRMTNEIGTKDSSDTVEFVEQLQNSSLVGSLDTEKRHDTVTPLYQRILSALIVEDEIEELEENGFGGPSSYPGDFRLIDTESRYRDGLDFCEPFFGVQTPKNGNAHIFVSCNGNTDYNRSPGIRHHPGDGDLMQGDSGYVHSEVEVLVRLSRYDYGSKSSQPTNFGISSIDCQYEQMCLEDKLVLELRSVGLFLETVPALDDREDKVINQDIVQLERGLHQQIGKKKMFLDNICKAIEEGKDVDKRDPEQLAMDKLVELAYKKLLATRGSFASKHNIAKVSKQGALAFAKRTLDRCRNFEDSGVSCFAEPTLHDAIYAAPTQITEGEPLISADLVVANGSVSGFADGFLSDALETSGHLSDQAFAKSGPISNRGKKKEVLLDDVGGAVFRATSNLGILGNAKGKRSERDPSTRNAVSRASMGGSKGERKTKAKLKQKIAQLSTSGNGVVNKFMDDIHPVYTSASGSGESANNTSNRKRDVRFMSSGNARQDSSKDINELATLPLNDIDSMEELGVDTDIGAPQDFNTWFNFDVDGLQDHDSVGLEIPMDDLSELNMF